MSMPSAQMEKKMGKVIGIGEKVKERVQGEEYASGDNVG